MAVSRHRATKHAKSATLAQRISGTLIPAVAAFALVGAAFAVAFGGSADLEATSVSTGQTTRDYGISDAQLSVSRGAERPALSAPDTANKAPKTKGTKYAKSELTPHVAADEKSPSYGTIKKHAKVKVTGRTDNEFTEISYDSEARWVQSDKLIAELPKPKPEPKPKAKATAKATEKTEKPAAPAGISGAPCASGSAVESGLTPATISVHRAVCALYPDIRSYGGLGGGEHAGGHAIDVMINNPGEGRAIADYVRAHAGQFHVSHVIYRQQIWTVQRAGEGWRAMPDRGSPTANHMDHVHVSTF